METWRMRKQWTPDALFSPPHGAGNQATSSFEVKSDEHQAKNTSLDHLRIYSRPVRSRVTNLRGAPGDQNRDIHFDVFGAETATRLQALSRLPSLTALSNNTSCKKYVNSCKTKLIAIIYQ